jgi:hypothetical protein
MQTIGKALALCVKSLLDKLIAEAPFIIRGIQVVGGSEFKSIFETECQAPGTLRAAARSTPLPHEAFVDALTASAATPLADKPRLQAPGQASPPPTQMC